MSCATCGLWLDVNNLYLCLLQDDINSGPDEIKGLLLYKVHFKCAVHVLKPFKA